MTSRRARQRAQAKPWQQPHPEPAPIDWAAIATDLKRREQNPIPAGRTSKS